MSVRERDPLTGHATTGHEWNGITELNTRVPRAIWWSIGITHRLGADLLDPDAVLAAGDHLHQGAARLRPAGAGSTKQIVEAQLERSAWSSAIEEMPIEADPRRSRR